MEIEIIEPPISICIYFSGSDIKYNRIRVVTKSGENECVAIVGPIENGPTIISLKNLDECKEMIEILEKIIVWKKENEKRK